MNNNNPTMTIMVIGKSGVGKSTFLNYAFQGPTVAKNKA